MKAYRLAGWKAGGHFAEVEPDFTLGHENAGWVEALGAGVHGWEIGQPVVALPW